MGKGPGLLPVAGVAGVEGISRFLAWKGPAGTGKAGGRAGLGPGDTFQKALVWIEWVSWLYRPGG